MKWMLILPLFLSSGLVGIDPANAHGAVIDYKNTEAIEIQSRYDTGKPLANAEVMIYAPNNPNEPWKTGKTDEEGNFMFIPDSEIPGYWEVKVRQAGHGGLVSIPVETNTAITETQSTQSSASLNPWQRGLMIASVMWGCMGTALFFMKSQPPTVEASSQSQS
jgi:nickel transport protein